MKFPIINKIMFIYKFHYFFFQAGIGPPQTAMPVYAQTLGFSSFIVGTIYTILPLSGLVIKPALGAIADKFKWHKAVMLGSEFIVMASYFCIQFIPSDFTPPVNNATQLSQMFCNNNSSISMCSNQTSGLPYLSVDSSAKCYIDCQLNEQSWDDLCRIKQFQSFCSSENSSSLWTKEEKCQKLPETMTTTLSICEAVEKNTLTCRKRCHGNGRAADDSDDSDQFQDDSVTVKQYQFYVFILLMIGSFAGTAVTTTLADTICIAKCEDPNDYGKQRLWGSIGYGILSVISGLIVDAISGDSNEKNYLPAFYLCLVVLLFDMIVSYFYIQVEIPEKSENIAVDVWKKLLNVKVIVFLVWCAAMGVSLGLTWTFLYWLLEDLAEDYGHGTKDNIKTISGLVNGVQTFLGETPAFFFSGWILNKIGHGHAMTIILFTIGLRFIAYSFILNPWLILIAEPLQLYYGLFYSTMTSYANIVAAPGTEATVQSIMCAVCEGIGVAIGSFLGGLFYDLYGGLICFRIFGISFFVMAFMNVCIELIYKYSDRKSKQFELPIQ